MKAFCNRDNFKITTCANNAGIGNKLVTFFAPHLDNFIVKNKSRPFTSIVIPALDRSVLKRQLNLSLGLAKIAPYPPSDTEALAKVCLATGTTFRLKYQDWWPDGCVR